MTQQRLASVTMKLYIFTTIPSTKDKQSTKITSSEPEITLSNLCQEEVKQKEGIRND